jgi:cellulose synthase operon protein C
MRDVFGFAKWILFAVLVGLGACIERSESQMMEQAHRQLELRDTAGATIELKNLLHRFPKSAEARFLLGKLLLEAGDAAGARSHLRIALDNGHATNVALPVMAAAMVSMGDFDALIKQYASVELTDNLAAAELKTQLAGAHLALKAVPEAEAALAYAMLRAPEHAPAVILSARLKSQKGEIAAALAQANDLLKRLPRNAPAWALRGDLLLRSTPPDSAAATEAYAKAIEIQADFLPAHVAWLTMLVDRQDFDAAGKRFAPMKAAAPRHPDTLYFEAILALQKGQPQRVREITDALLRGPKQDPRVLMLAGQAEIQLQSSAKAEAMLSKAMKLAPGAVPPRRMLAQLYLANGQPEQAMAVLKPVFDAGFQDAGLWVLMGRGQLMSGAAKDAEASFARAAKLRPDDNRIKASITLARLGQGHGSKALSELETLAASDASTTADMALISERMRRKEFDGALKAIDVLAGKQPTLALPDLLRGRIALQRRDAAGARASFEAAVKKEPANFQAVSGLAAVDMDEGKTDSARARYQSLLERDPGNTGAHLALAGMAARARAGKEEVARVLSVGIAANPSAATLRATLIDHHMSVGETAQALAVAQSAVAAITDHPELLDRLGQVQQASGDINQAIPTFNKMVALQPKSALPHLRLADAHMANKNSEAAAASVRRALEADPWSLPAQPWRCVRRSPRKR